MSRRKQNDHKEFLVLLQNVSSKRATIVIEHILQHGFITTEEIEERYGYEHPPRAVRDVRESGIPLETFRVKSSSGKSIAAYRFGDLSAIQYGRKLGRAAFPKSFKKQLFDLSGGNCAICNGRFANRYLQIDHCIPYEVAGDVSVSELILENFMLLCSSCNRAKSWSCEQCQNWKKTKIPESCRKCYWGNPLSYEHIALRQIRRVDLQWEKRKFSFSRHFKSKRNGPLFDCRTLSKKF